MDPRLLLDTLWVLATRTALRVANLVAFLLLARALTVAELGFWGYVTATATVLSVAFDIGLRQSTAYITGHEPARRGAAVTHMLVLSAGLGLAASGACWLALAGAGYTGTFGAVALVGAANAAPMLVLRTGQGAFLGTGRLARMNATELVSRAVLLLGTSGLAAAGALTVEAALWVLLAAHAIAAAWLVAQLAAEIDGRTLVDLPLVRALLTRGGTFAAGILLLLLMNRAGIWIVAAELGDRGLGLWFGVQRLGEMLVEVATAVGLVLFSHGVRTEDVRAAAFEAVRAARLVTALMALVGIAAGLLASPLLEILLGPDYAAEAGPFRVVMLGTIAACFNAMLYPSLGAVGLARAGILAYALGCAVAVIATSTLVDRFGLAGAAVGYAVAQAVVTVVLAQAYRRRFGFSAARVLLPQHEDREALRALGRGILARIRRRRGAG